MLILVSHVLDAVLPAEIKITRVAADTNFLFPKNAKRLTRFMMAETYGECKPFSAAWAQRSVLDAAADSDFFGRLAYYDETRKAGQPQGDIFVAEKDDGTLAGFADLGASLWLPNDGAFRLPLSPDLRRLAETGVGTDGLLKPGVELRPYVSNLVVTQRSRRCGVGRLLMEACEEAAQVWAGGRESATPFIWLEVTESNEAGLGFYRALGYEVDGATEGTEVTRDGDAFSMADVRRCVMRKAMSLRGGYALRTMPRGGGCASVCRTHKRTTALRGQQQPPPNWIDPPPDAASDFAAPSTSPALRAFLMGAWSVKRVSTGTFSVPSMAGRFAGVAQFQPSGDSEWLVAYTESGTFSSKDMPPLETSTSLTYDFKSFEEALVYYEDASGERRFLHSVNPRTLELSDASEGDSVSRGQLEIGEPDAFILSRTLTGPSNNGTILTMFTREGPGLYSPPQRNS